MSLSRALVEGDTDVVFHWIEQGFEGPITLYGCDLVSVIVVEVEDLIDCFVLHDISIICKMLGVTMFNCGVEETQEKLTHYMKFFHGSR